MAPMTPEELAFLAAARTATLATIAQDGAPRLVPICFVVDPGGPGDPGDPPSVWTPLDEKPKRAADIRDLARVRDIVARPVVALLVDRWSEDWAELAWLRLEGEAMLVEAEADPSTHAAVVAALRAKYPQYQDHDLEARPLIRIRILGARSWSASPR